MAVQTFIPQRKSNFIAKFGYNPRTEVLRVYMTREDGTGAFYDYGNVSPSKWYRLRKDGDAGRYYNRLIKGRGNQHPRLRKGVRRADGTLVVS